MCTTRGGPNSTARLGSGAGLWEVGRRRIQLFLGGYQGKIRVGHMARVPLRNIERVASSRVTRVVVFRRDTRNEQKYP